MDYSFLTARLFFTFVYTCIFFSWQINSAAAAAAAFQGNRRVLWNKERGIISILQNSIVN